MPVPTTFYTLVREVNDGYHFLQGEVATEWSTVDLCETFEEAQTLFDVVSKDLDFNPKSVRIARVEILPLRAGPRANT